MQRVAHFQWAVFGTTFSRIFGVRGRSNPRCASGCASAFSGRATTGQRISPAGRVGRITSIERSSSSSSSSWRTARLPESKLWISSSWLFSVHQKMHAPLAGGPVRLIAIRRRGQGVEIAKRASRAAQHHRGLLFTRNLAKPGSVTDLFVTEETFLLRGIHAWPGDSLEVGSSHNNRLSTSPAESRTLRGQFVLASGMPSE